MSTVLAECAHVVRDRLVLTYAPAGLPVGVVTAREDAYGGVAVEHVVVWPGQPPATLLTLARLGLDAAWAQGYRHVTVTLPRALPGAGALLALARRHAFLIYAMTDDVLHCVRYAPRAE